MNCARCGKKLPRYLLTIWREPTDPPLVGQPLRDKSQSATKGDVWKVHAVIRDRTERETTYTNAREQGWRAWLVWAAALDTGEPEYRGYQPFCTLRCSLTFARAAYRDGYRYPHKRARAAR